MTPVMMLVKWRRAERLLRRKLATSGYFDQSGYLLAELELRVVCRAIRDLRVVIKHEAAMRSAQLDVLEAEPGAQILHTPAVAGDGPTVVIHRGLTLSDREQWDRERRKSPVTRGDGVVIFHGCHAEGAPDVDE